MSSMQSPAHDWWSVSNVDEVPSPALLIYQDRALENLRRMVALAGDASRLTPHVKTHKLEPLVRAHLDAGISRFKCATIAEAESVAVAGGRDVLLAHQPVGPGIGRLIALAAQFPQTRVSVIADDPGTIAAIGAAAAAAGRTVPILLDLDVGMHRTGIEPGAAAADLYRSLAATAGVEAGGLHAYDGHLRDADPVERARKSDAAFAAVDVLRRSLLDQRLAVPRVVAGGSPTFPAHARRSGVELSPGTTVLWDAGYATQLPDLAFLPAALLLTRVVSKPGGHRRDARSRAQGGGVGRPASARGVDRAAGGSWQHRRHLRSARRRQHSACRCSMRRLWATARSTSSSSRQARRASQSAM